MTTRSQTGGGKLNRSETVTVRLDPKLRYLAEIAARKQRRTISSFIEWAIEDGLQRVTLRDDDQYPRSVASDAAELWDVDEPDRFVKLALRYPDLLTHEEQVRWKLIRENGHVWKNADRGSGRQWEVREEAVAYGNLREHWETFKAVAAGLKPRSELPKLQDQPAQEKVFEDDDIPF